MRILCVLLTHFPINCEKLRNHDTTHPLIMTTTVGSQKLVLDYSPECKGLLVGVNYFCRLTTIIFAGSPLSFFGRSCCRDYVAGLLRCGSWAH